MSDFGVTTNSWTCECPEKTGEIRSLLLTIEHNFLGISTWLEYGTCHGLFTIENIQLDNTRNDQSLISGYLRLFHSDPISNWFQSNFQLHPLSFLGLNFGHLNASLEPLDLIKFYWALLVPYWNRSWSPNHFQAQLWSKHLGSLAVLVPGSTEHHEYHV